MVTFGIFCERRVTSKKFILKWNKNKHLFSTFFGFFQGLPQLAEKNTPQPTDVVGEYVL